MKSQIPLAVSRGSRDAEKEGQTRSPFQETGDHFIFPVTRVKRVPTEYLPAFSPNVMTHRFLQAYVFLLVKSSIISPAQNYMKKH